MTHAATLAVELLTEELPPKALKGLGDAFSTLLADGLRTRGFLEGDSEMSAFATPRRLAVTITNVREAAPDAEVVDKLMPAKVAFAPSGEPTEALRKKLASYGRAHLATAEKEAWDGPDRRYSASDGKAEYVYLRRLAKGQSLDRGLDEALTEAIEKLPIRKVMRYAAPDDGYYNEIAFIRPAHKLLALHGDSIIQVSALGLTAGRTTDGHRFLSRKDIAIASADAYEATLEAEGKLVPSFAKRRAAIVGALQNAAQGAQVVMPDALLDEVTALCELPHVHAGTFDRAFLEVPQECLILTMQQNQKYFALADAHGRLQSRFLLVSNLATEHPQAIVDGNERVLRARLADAKFFYDQDRRQKLESRVDRLNAIVYHNKLGTLGQRVDRVRRLAAALAREIGADEAAADRAARLAKADLVTDMVGEFPELQGVMGRYYALHDGEPAEIADAIAQHYWPRFAGDALPQHAVAQAVALADKFEALAGLFGVGQLPTGDKDPFGLRRAALGALRILIEKHIAVPLGRLVDLAFAMFDDVAAVKPAHAELREFFADRLRGHLREQAYSVNQVEAVLARNLERIDLVPEQLAAVAAFEALPEADALAAANKRIVNILRKSGAEASAIVDRTLLANGAEQDLFAAFEKLEPVVNDRCTSGDWTGALKALATTKPAVDRFFDDVLVMADDRAVRGNRLALLRGVAATMNRVADISKLAQ